MLSNANSYLYTSLSSVIDDPQFSKECRIPNFRNVELYPQFFLELITTQLRFYMVSPQLSLLIILTMQSYKFYIPNFDISIFGMQKVMTLLGCIYLHKAGNNSGVGTSAESEIFHHFRIPWVIRIANYVALVVTGRQTEKNLQTARRLQCLSF